MTAINRLLDRTTHPTRKPYVRDTTFIDGIGPPPYGFLDETQDHLAGQFQAALGWTESVDSDEFTEASAPTGYFGRLRVTNRVGALTYDPFAATGETGEHGVWSMTGDTNPWIFKAEGGYTSLEDDFLLTAKVKIVNVSEIDPFVTTGFRVTVGPDGSSPACPGFFAGSTSPNWQILYAPDESTPLTIADTGVPVVNGKWYRLQLSRVAGALRWFINGAPMLLNRLPGLYYPFPLLNGRKMVECSRFKPGGAGNGFFMDSFHLRAKRPGVL